VDSGGVSAGRKDQDQDRRGYRIDNLTPSAFKIAVPFSAMPKPSRQLLGLSVIGILLSVLLITSPNLRVPPLDEQADSFFRGSIGQATLAYATCRVINGSVSVLKESDLQLQPTGVGVSLAVGQALDPIDDMVERASDVLVMSITSLGLQKLVYEMSVALAPGLLGGLLLILSVSLWIPHPRLRPVQRTGVQVLLILLIARFCLPLSSMANAYVNRNFFQPQIEETRKGLALGVSELKELQEFTLPEIDGLRGTLDNSVAFVKTKSVAFKEGLIAVTTHAGEVVESLLTLTFLYIGVFLIQVILLPAGVLWILLKLSNSLFVPRRQAEGSGPAPQ
jgi:hypothetical protein